MRSSGIGAGALAGLLAGALFLGCGSSSSKDGDTGGGATDAASDRSGGSSGGGGDAGGGDAGANADVYPAFPPAMPQIQNAKGGLLDKAKIVTVTWASDTNAPALQAFDDALVASSYWKDTTTEYGVGAGTSTAADHVVVQTAPPSPWDDTAIDTWVQQMASTSATSGWPAPDAETIYVVYIPPGVQVTDQGTDACTALTGYHTQLPATGSQPAVTYALILDECAAVDQVPFMQNATETSSHEIVEATADPFNTPSWYGFDLANSLSWELWNEWQDEIADACESFDEGYYLGGTDLPYWLSRIWSNASAKAGHDPCVPVPSGAYNNVTPLGLQTLTVQAWDGGQDSAGNNTISAQTSKGWRIAPGATATVKVGFYSDAPMAAWKVTAAEGDCCGMGGAGDLTVTPSTFSGKNGDTVDLTIKVNKAPAQGTAALLTFSSDAGNTVSHYMPVVVGTY